MLKNVKTSITKPKVISLFSGAGGMDIGFEKAGFEIAVAVEFDSSCCDTLRKNRPDTPVIEGDISALKTNDILEKAGLKVLEAGLVIGGPPCQSFSLAGKRLGMDEPRGRLVLEFIRIVRESLPVAFVMENVKGMANWHKGEALEAIENVKVILYTFEELAVSTIKKGLKVLGYIVYYALASAVDSVKIGPCAYMSLTMKLTVLAYTIMGIGITVFYITLTLLWKERKILATMISVFVFFMILTRIGSS